MVSQIFANIGWGNDLITAWRHQAILYVFENHSVRITPTFLKGQGIKFILFNFPPCIKKYDQDYIIIATSVRKSLWLEKLSVSLALCVENTPVTTGFSITHTHKHTKPQWCVPLLSSPLLGWNQYELTFKYIKYCLYKDGIMNIETAACYWCGQRAKFCHVNYLADQVVPEAG